MRPQKTCFVPPEYEAGEFSQTACYRSILNVPRITKDAASVTCYSCLEAMRERERLAESCREDAALERIGGVE